MPVNNIEEQSALEEVDSLARVDMDILEVESGQLNRLLKINYIECVDLLKNVEVFSGFDVHQVELLASIVKSIWLECLTVAAELGITVEGYLLRAVCFPVLDFVNLGKVLVLTRSKLSSYLLAFSPKLRSLQFSLGHSASDWRTLAPGSLFSGCRGPQSPYRRRHTAYRSPQAFQE